MYQTIRLAMTIVILALAARRSEPRLQNRKPSRLRPMPPVKPVTLVFQSHAKEHFGLSTPEEIVAAMKRNRENFADAWGDRFFESQNKMLQQGMALGLLPSVGNLNDLWIK
jgi:hypothetical protein